LIGMTEVAREIAYRRKHEPDAALEACSPEAAAVFQQGLEYARARNYLV
jgi:hypothetical protein